MSLGWTPTRIGDLADYITKGTTPTSIGHEFVREGINFLKVETLTEDGKFVNSKFGHITKQCHEDMKRSQLKEGDILLNIIKQIKYY